MEGYNNEKKSDRHRKKRFYNSIREQVEFYLGDVNLSKDRFFTRLLEESPYIDIDVVLKCNKIKKLTTDPKDIVKALKKSSILSVTEDETKVFRTVSVNQITNGDDCTIYVEDLPMEVDHEWLKNVFNAYGKVVYVSIPQYRTTRKIKGFAFIQFDSPENAHKAINAFRSVDSCLSCSMEPTKLRSVQTFEGEKNVVTIEHHPINVENIKCVRIRRVTESEDDDAEPQRKRRKRTKNDSISKEIDSVEECQKSNEKENVEGENVSRQTDDEVKNEEPDMAKSEDEGTDADNSNKNSHKKRKRKKAKKSEQVQTYGMQILSKKDWKKLRNKYLEEQRKRMHELKQQLRMASIKQYEKTKSNLMPETPEENIETEKSSVSDCRVKFTPGVIVKLSLDQPIKDVKSFKNEVKRYADVEYIDVNENDSVAYVRCSSNEAANQLIALNKWQNMIILQGDEELAYWEKIKQDRKEKIENKIRPKTRGKNKLIKKVEATLATHIKFPD